jgi:hypothetical protein
MIMDLKNVVFDSNFSLNFGSANQKRIYGFCYENFENDILKNQIHYEIEVNILSDSYGDNCIFEINRKQFFLNNKAPDSKIEQMADKASRTLFPLHIKIKKNGEIEEILNAEDIKKRWQSAKKEILQYYKGDIIDKIVNKMDGILSNDNALKKSICQNWFFHLFFKPIYVEYTSKLRFKSIWKSPVFGNQFIEYGVFQTVNEQYDQNDKIIINAHGNAIDDRTVDEIIDGYHFPKKYYSEEQAETVDSSMSVEYKLYQEDRSIFSITGTFETKINESLNKKIQIEIHHFAKTSSFRPWSDAAFKKSSKIFQSYQNKEDDDIINVAERIKKIQAETPKKERILGLPKENNYFYIHQEPVAEIKKRNFTDKLKSLFKKNK